MRGRFALSDSDSSISQNTPPAVHINLPGRRLEIPNPKTPSRANPALKSPRTPRNNHQPVVRQATPRPANTRAQLLGNKLDNLLDGLDTPTQLPVNQYRY